MPQADIHPLPPLHKYTSAANIEAYFIGPKLEKGPLPALFYFALSAEQSLLLDPFNQPIAHFFGKEIRIFSFTLPFHGTGFENSQAIALWAQAYQQQDDLLGNFLNEAECAIVELIEQGFVTKHKIAFCGLSRGAFIATHLAARFEEAHFVLGFAPLVSLSTVIEFKPFNHLQMVQALDLNNISRSLAGKNLRFYIGNRDERVMTDVCYAFIHHLVDVNYQAGHRSPPVELILSPSVGFKGHGTLPHIFGDGAQWLLDKWL